MCFAILTTSSTQCRKHCPQSRLILIAILHCHLDKFDCLCSSTLVITFTQFLIGWDNLRKEKTVNWYQQKYKAETMAMNCKKSGSSVDKILGEGGLFQCLAQKANFLAFYVSFY